MAPVHLAKRRAPRGTAKAATAESQVRTFLPSAEKFHNRNVNLPLNPQPTVRPLTAVRPVRSRRSGARIASSGSEATVFRAVVLSIAMTIALGPSAAAVCGALCSPQAPVADRCHHTTSMVSPHLTPADICIERPLSVAAAARDDTPRDRSCGVLRSNSLTLAECRNSSCRQTISPASLLTRGVLPTPLRI